MNIVRFAAAGSGKTYGICQQAIVCAHKSKANRILMVTYTNRGKNAIIDELEAQNRGIIPKNIVVLSWYQFLLKELIKPYQVQIQEVLCSRRFNAAICNFANSVYPNDKNMTSSMTEKTEHDGVFIIAKKDAMVYFEHFSPQELRYDRRTSGTCGDGAVNFGECKGMTYNRCLIYANKTFVQFLKGQKLETPEKYYVAVTRARYSNAIIVDELFGAVGFEKCKIKIGEDEIDAEKYLGNLN